MAGTPVLKCPSCGGTLEYHVTIEMLDPPIGKIDTGYCRSCARLLESVRESGTYYQSTAWPPLCRECRQPVTFAGMGASDDVARYHCREHAREQWTWSRTGDRWMRVDS